VRALYDEVRVLVPDVELLEPAEAVARQPLLRPGSFELGLLEPGAMEIDVHALHQLFVHEFRSRGGRIVATAPVERATRGGGVWTVEAAAEQWQAPIVVDAAGAWADRVAAVFGAGPVGLRALRRCAFMVDAPPAARAPMIADLDDAFYVKPDAGRLLCSPADEAEQEPGDARPDETEIARAIDVINEVTTLQIRHVRSAWAGLRTFVRDRSPVVGFDPEVDGLFWYAAQGGYGIQTAPGLARTGAALLRGEPVPADLAGRGLTRAALAPERLRAGNARNADPAARG
jgi:D-arginine dehydrogenase